MNIFSAAGDLFDGSSASMDGGNAIHSRNGTDFLDTMLTQAGHVSPLMHVLAYIYRLVRDRFGVDPSLVVTILGFAWGVSAMVSQVFSFVEGLVDVHLRSSISISENDPIYLHIMKWMSAQPKISNDRYLMAQTEYCSAWEETDEAGGALCYSDGGDDSGEHRYLNFSSQAAHSAPRYVPAMGATRFWHRGKYFTFSRKKEFMVNTTNRWGAAMKNIEEITISCYGRSVDPIKALLRDARDLFFVDTHQRTTIYRPVNKEYRREWNMWQQVARRPIRPMRTVVLDDQSKHQVLGDINEYLHPATPAWYASRGIPLRRGYLFHGPPGTGKTSFSFAIAGVFGIDIYVISLQDVNVTEEDLAALFAKLPRRCIVLLEDIDSAGLKRTEDQAEALEEDTKKTEGEKGKEGKLKRESEGASPRDDERRESGEAEGKVANVNWEAKEPVKSKMEARSGQDAEPEDPASTCEGDAKEACEERKPKTKRRKNGAKRTQKDDGSASSSEPSDSSSSEEASKRKRKRKSHVQMRKKRYISSRRGRGSTTVSMESISLSGLLNAIDGVASHEGRVLIMTTNKPESLDEALVRPGRVDMQVGFRNATARQAAELFRRMYEARAPPLPTPGGRGTAEKETKEAAAGELPRLAEQFGALVPGESLSPAEIQGFLLKRKTSPRRALEEAPRWIEGVVRQREAKSKVTVVQ